MELLWKDDNLSYSLSFNSELNEWITHVEAKTITPSLLKKYRKFIKVEHAKLKARGIDRVFGICETKKERKFNMLFGYKAVPNGIILTEDGILNYLTTMEI
jgi:hypothetical protein